MSPLQLPVTLITACLLGLIYFVLMLRVSQLRWRHKVSLGDGGNQVITRNQQTGCVAVVEWAQRHKQSMVNVENTGV